MKRQLAPCVLCFLLLSLAGASAQTSKLATQARVDLLAASSVGSLSDGAVITGGGTVERQTWLSADQWTRSYTIQVPIVRFAWNEFALRFTPAKSGPVTVTLKGPYEEITPGNIYREEVLWDALQATNTTIGNASFETVSGTIPSGWTGSGTYQAGSGAVPAVDGVRMARTWHNADLSRNINVTAGSPVTIRFFARALVPSGFKDMTPIADRNTPAHQTALKLMRGVNFGNYLDGAPGVTYSSSDFALVRSEGFDHVRLPVAWQNNTGPGPTYTLSATIFSKVDAIVNGALGQGLGVIIDIHNFNAFMADPAGNTNKFYSIWEQVAAHYAAAGPGVVFELLNEPSGAATTALMNSVYPEAIRRIRQTNPSRTIMVGPGAYNGIGELNNLILPDGDHNLMVALHSYDPFLFTHQGATWTGPDTATRGLVYPGPPPTPVTPAAGVASWVTNWISGYNTQPPALNPCSALAFAGRLQMVRRWADYYGRPVQLGEFGAYETADNQSRVNYYRDMRQVLEQLGIGWAMWDWKAGFHYIQGGQPEPPQMRDALFPSPSLQTTMPGAVTFDGAIAKTFVVERSVALGSPPSWQPVSTQTLTSPKFIFEDGDTNRNPAAYYRVRWAK